MKFTQLTLLLLLGTMILSCKAKEETNGLKGEAAIPDSLFQWKTESFADIQILRYRVPGFEQLAPKQRLLVYYLVQAGLAGRDIIWDQNYRHNLSIRHALNKIVDKYSGDRNNPDWRNFVDYTKQVWFANGIHHHYSSEKILPRFTQSYFKDLMVDSGTELDDMIIQCMFDPKIDSKKVSLDPTKDIVSASAVNFYDIGLTDIEVEAFYNDLKAATIDTLLSYGLNSKLVLGDDGKIEEKVWRLNGMYGAAIKKIIYWLEMAVEVAENPEQAKSIQLLIEYYKTGDLKKWDEFNIAWVENKSGDVDFIHGFVEVYNDPKGMKGSYESIVQITDFESSARMKALSDHAQWFEDNSPILSQHKKKNVTGVSYKVVNVAGESGDAAPLSSIGVNLPNADWIKEKHGSKSVSLGNISNAIGFALGSGVYDEFASTAEDISRHLKYGSLADKMMTALHEVIGHASGKLEPNIKDPATTLKNYSSAIEEARADIVALYYVIDPKLVELKLLPSTDAGKAAYDNYISNGLLKQLRRMEPGRNIEESHMRNRQMIAAWAFEQGKKENVISKISRLGKTYFQINDYTKLRAIFGNLLREIQRIKSQGDYTAARNLIENYGVIVDQRLLAEVKDRASKLNIPPYSGFIQPEYNLVYDKKGKAIDVEVRYPKDFTIQMLGYSKMFGYLPPRN